METVRQLSLSILLIVLWNTPIFCQQLDTLKPNYQYPTEIYGINEGLPSLTINDIYQDAQGMIWLATNNGLSRFDGKKFENFKNDLTDETGFSDSRVSSIYQADDGIIWVGSFDGLKSIDPHSKEIKNEIERSEEHPKVMVTDIIPDLNNGYLWVCFTNAEIVQFNIDSKTFQSYKLPPEAMGRTTVLKTLYQTQDGTIWAGAWGNIRSGLWKLDTATGNWEHVIKTEASRRLINKVTDIVEDDDGNLWLATIDDGLVCFNPKTYNYEHFRWNTNTFYTLGGKVLDSLGQLGIDEQTIKQLKPISREKYKVRNNFIKALNQAIGIQKFNKYQSLLLQYSFGYGRNPLNKIVKVNHFLYLATEHGVYRFNLKNKTFQKVLNGFYSTIEVPMNGKKGLLWGAKKGLVKASLDADVFQRFILPHNCEGCKAYIKRLTETRPGVLYFSRKGDYPLVQFDENNNSVSFINKNIVKRTSIREMEPVEGELWFGGKGLNHFIKDSSIYHQYNYKDIPRKTAFLKADGKTIWHTADLQLASFDIISKEFKIYNIDNNYPESVSSLEQAPNRHVWFWQDYSNVLYEFDPVAETFTGHDTSAIRGAILPLDSIVWIGNADGLYSYSLETKEKRLHRLFGDNTLFNVNDIAQHQNGDLWLATSIGLVRYRPNSKTARLYDQKDGVPSRSSEILLISQSGYIYAGYKEGFFRFDPDKLRSITSVPPVVLTELSIFNQPIDFQQKDSPLEKPISLTESIILPYDQNYLSFDFVFASHLKSDYNRYSYMLQGVDKDWNEASSNKATYTGIPPGKYTFMVKAINVDGQWSEVTQLDVTISPPWWKIWWVRALFIAVFLFSGVVFYRYRTSQLNKRNLILEEQVKERTQEIQQKQKEILTQNEELRQTQEEIQAQRDHIAIRNKELERKNRQIHDSIVAAEVIQQTILPSKIQLSKCFDEYFVLFKPRDIVSGDFYWLSEREEEKWLVVADCTGHGVPGAFMTLLGKNILDKLINQLQLQSPSEVLNRLHGEVKQMFAHREKDDIQRGMDLSVLKIGKTSIHNKVHIEYAGAKSHLYIYEQPDIQEVLGDRVAIGSDKEHVAYTNYQMEVAKASTIYLTSDGYQDQNNQDRKRFGRRRLRNLLQEYADQPLHSQQVILETELAGYMEHTEQRDDILLVGVKI